MYGNVVSHFSQILNGVYFNMAIAYLKKGLSTATDTEQFVMLQSRDQIEHESLLLSSWTI